jgi:hypothetical protein
VQHRRANDAHRGSLILDQGLAEPVGQPREQFAQPGVHRVQRTSRACF